MGFKPITEVSFMQTVKEYAKIKKWWVLHVHDSRKTEPGLPDLMMIRNGQLIFAELKVGRGKTSEDQDRVIELLRAVEHLNSTVKVFVWYDKDWNEIQEVLS